MFVGIVVVVVALAVIGVVLVAHRKRMAVLLEMRKVVERVDAHFKAKP